MFSVLTPSLAVEIRMRLPDLIVTESLPFSALPVAVTFSVRFLTERSSFDFTPLSNAVSTISVPLPESFRSHAA